MDKLDTQILKALTKDAQESFLSISKKIGASPKTVQTRYNKLVKKGILIKCSIIVDLSKLGYKGKAYLMISLEEGCTRENLVASLQKRTNVFLITEVIGGNCDVLAVAAIKDFHDLLDLAFEIKELHCVSQIDIDLTNDTTFPINHSFNSLIG